MVTLTIECSRCGKEASQDMTNTTLNNDIIRKLGFSYANDGKKNIVICNDCGRQYKDLQERLEDLVKVEMCDFFNNCEETENANFRGTKNG